MLINPKAKATAKATAMAVKAQVKAQARRVLARPLPRPRTLLPAFLVFLMLCFLGIVHHERMSQRDELARLKAMERDPGMNTHDFAFVFFFLFVIFIWTCFFFFFPCCLLPGHN